MEGREKSANPAATNAHASQIASIDVTNHSRRNRNCDLVLMGSRCPLVGKKDNSQKRTKLKYRLFLGLVGICIVPGLFTNLVVTLMFI
jgi:hypothetical protein